MNLNEDQEIALITLNEFMCNDSNHIILSGPAGTGKTTVISKFIDNWRLILALEACAPTHAALDELHKHNNKLQCSTLQSFLKLRPSYKSGGRRVFIPSMETGRYDCDVLIIDECSMVSQDIFKMLTDFISCKIIFVGDSYQLPPVGEKISDIFSAGFDEVSLTIQMRTDRYGFLFEQFRIFVDTHIFPEIDDDLVYSKYDKQKVFDEYLENPDIKLIAHRNSQVSDYNKLIRNTEEEFRIGERLVFVDYYSVNYNKYYTGCEIILDDINKSIQFHPWGKSFQVWNVKFYKPIKDCKDKPDGVLLRSLRIVCKEDRPRYVEMCNKHKNMTVKNIRGQISRKKSAIWAEYYELSGLYNPPLKYSYSNNVYKSQSHTYDVIRIDVNDIMETARSCKYKAMYTAVTRGSKDIKFIM